MTYLVLGNAQLETITQSETGLSRNHLGGVGAIMARELALAGANVTLVTTAPPGPATREVQEAIEDSGIKPMVIPGNPPQTRRGYAHITTHKGNVRSVKGDWPRMGLLGPIVSQVNADWTLISLQLQPKDLHALQELKGPKAVNATSKKHASLIPQIPNQAVYTMNSSEATALMLDMSVLHEEDLPRALGADTVMITRGQHGRTTYTQAQPVLCHDAVPVPDGADFIGCGDAATAGLVFALAEGLDQEQTVNSFVTDLMRRNALAYPRGKTG